MPRKSIKKSSRDISDQLYFWTNDGRILRSLADLAVALREMNDGVFKHHVNVERNDFAKWIEEILGEPVFARKMRTMKSRLTALRSVEAELKKYQ